MTNIPCLDHGRKGFGLGYATAWVVIDGHKMCTTLHRKVHYEATGEWPEVVRHICDNARCIEPTHLRSGTQVENVADMHERGRHRYGGDPRRGDSRGYGTVLTDDEVRFIRNNCVPRHPAFGVTALAKKYSVSIAQISRIANGKRRSHA